MTKGRARLPLTTLYVVASALFWLPAAGLTIGIPAGVATMLVSDKPLAIHAVVPAEELGNFSRMFGVEASVTVAVPIDDITVTQVAAYHIAILAAGLAYLYGAWQLRQLVRSIRENDTFSIANVRRLRVLGALLLFGYPLFRYLAGSTEQWILSTGGPPGLAARVEFEPFALAAALGGLCLLVLAEVFAHGIVLREDVEATV